jgi:low affinity Fe/Cu permease
VFERFSSWVDEQTAKPQAFTAACAAIVLWAIAGPFFHFSDTWQLAINTSTTIVTFLMVFLLQNSQSRAMERHYLLTEQSAAQEPTCG